MAVSLSFDSIDEYVSAFAQDLEETIAAAYIHDYAAVDVVRFTDEKLPTIKAWETDPGDLADVNEQFDRVVVTLERYDLDDVDDEEFEEALEASSVSRSELEPPA